MKIYVTILFSIILKSIFSQELAIQDSRDNCVMVYSELGKSIGTGFFIDKAHIVTCFHVIANSDDGTIKYFNDIIIVTNEGEQIRAKISTKVAPEDSTPLKYDFAILSLLSQPKKYKLLDLKFNETNEIGSKIIFSGFPFGNPTMLTHSGNISGFKNDSNVICIQSSINKGNSGGAIINEKKQIIGIITLREGGINQELQNVLNEIKSSESYGNIQLMGIDPLKAQKETIQVLNKYISTGIGYAYSIRYMMKWYEKYLK